MEGHSSSLIRLVCQLHRIIVQFMFFLWCRWATETRWHPWPRDSIQRHPSWANSTGSEALSFTLANSCGYRWKEKVGQKAELPMHRVRFLVTITSPRMTYLRKKKVILISFSVIVLYYYIISSAKSIGAPFIYLYANWGIQDRANQQFQRSEVLRLLSKVACMFFNFL